MKELEPSNRISVKERILLYKWAGEDPMKATELSKLDGMDQYANSDLCEHYLNTSKALDVMQRHRERNM